MILRCYAVAVILGCWVGATTGEAWATSGKDYGISCLRYDECSGSGSGCPAATVYINPDPLPEVGRRLRFRFACNCAHHTANDPASPPSPQGEQCQSQCTRTCMQTEFCE